MKNLKDILEGQNFLVNKKLKNRQDKYEYHPKDKYELIKIIEDLLKKGITDLNCIDVSEITKMNNLFWSINPNTTVSEIDISNWDVSNVKDMGSMFENCKEFNSDLSKWDISNVTNMRYMFCGCTTFNSDLSNWNVSNVGDMDFMFYQCKTLKKNNKIPKWYKH